MINVVFGNQLDKLVELSSIDEFVGPEQGGFVAGGGFGGFFDGFGCGVRRRCLLASSKHEKGEQ